MSELVEDQSENMEELLSALEMDDSAKKEAAVQEAVVEWSEVRKSSALSGGDAGLELLAAIEAEDIVQTEVCLGITVRRRNARG